MTTENREAPMQTFIADVDLVGSRMDRPYMRLFVEAQDDDAALERARALIERTIPESGVEEVRGVTPLQPILDRVREAVAAGRAYSIAFKYETDDEGPVWITDLAAVTGPTAVPFGSELPGTTALPWMKLAGARRLARYLGLELAES